MLFLIRDIIVFVDLTMDHYSVKEYDHGTLNVIVTYIVDSC